MKILTVSDEVVPIVQSPRIVERFGDVELVLSCGDLPPHYLEYIVTLLNVPLYYVIGNHDGGIRRDPKTYEKSFPSGCVNIDDRIVEYRGLLIGGLEGSMRYSGEEYQYTEFEMRMKILRMGPKLWFNNLTRGRPIDILITHAPPLGIHDGEDLCHRGFKSFLSFMDKYKPRYLIHGHKHLYSSKEPTETMYGATKVINTCGYKIIEI
ncbi:MAG: metallophosphoesterase [bacterium]